MTIEWMLVFSALILMVVAELLKDRVEDDKSKIKRISKRVFAKYIELFFIGTIATLLIKLYSK